MASLFVEDTNDESSHFTVFAEIIATEDTIVAQQDTGLSIHLFGPGIKIDESGDY